MSHPHGDSTARRMTKMNKKMKLMMMMMMTRKSVLFQKDPPKEIKWNWTFQTLQLLKFNAQINALDIWPHFILHL